MKNIITLCLLLFASINPSFSQTGQEKVLSISLNKAAQFRVLIGDTYQIEPDTVFNSPPGFKVHSFWEEKKFPTDTATYLILTYPNFFKEESGQNNQRSHLKKFADAGLTDRPVHQLDYGLTIGLDDSLSYPLPGLVAEPRVRKSILGVNGKNLVISKKDFLAIPKDTVFGTGYKGIATGQLTLPFKFRPGIKNGGDPKPFAMSTDVTIGAYAGPRFRISKRQNYYIVVPLTLGLSFINVNENSTTATGIADIRAGIYPGITGAAGAIVQVGTFTFGIVGGLDCVSQVGKDWVYQGKPWASFAIGYSFLK